MRLKFAYAFAVVCAFPAAAEDTPAPEDGLSLMERGAQMLMEGMRRELEPALEGLADMGPAMRDFVAQMGPALGALLDEVEDWSVYEAPEMLPNGDIIIRRKPAPEPDAPPAPQAPGDPIEL